MTSYVHSCSKNITINPQVAEELNVTAAVQKTSLD